MISKSNIAGDQWTPDWRYTLPTVSVSAEVPAPHLGARPGRRSAAAALCGDGRLLRSSYLRWKPFCGSLYDTRTTAVAKGTAKRRVPAGNTLWRLSPGRRAPAAGRKVPVRLKRWGQAGAAPSPPRLPITSDQARPRLGTRLPGPACGKGGATAGTPGPAPCHQQEARVRGGDWRLVSGERRYRCQECCRSSGSRVSPPGCPPCQSGRVVSVPGQPGCGGIAEAGGGSGPPAALGLMPTGCAPLLSSRAGMGGRPGGVGDAWPGAEPA